MVYNLPYRGGRDVSREILYPVTSWDVLLPDDELRAVGMQDTGLLPFHTGNLRMYVPEQAALAKGGKVSFRLAGQPRAVSTPGSDTGAVLAGVLSVALAASLGAVLILARLRRAR